MIHYIPAIARPDGERLFPDPRLLEAEDFACTYCAAVPGQPCLLRGHTYGSHAARVDRFLKQQREARTRMDLYATKALTEIGAGTSRWQFGPHTVFERMRVGAYAPAMLELQRLQELHALI